MFLKTKCLNLSFTRVVKKYFQIKVTRWNISFKSFLYISLVKSKPSWSNGHIISSWSVCQSGMLSGLFILIWFYVTWPVKRLVWKSVLSRESGHGYPLSIHLTNIFNNIFILRSSPWLAMWLCMIVGINSFKMLM